MVVTELLLDGSQPQGDMVELHNPTRQPVDISGWFISDSPDDLFKFQVPPQTVIPAGGYAVFTQQQMGFGLDAARGGQDLAAGGG